MYEIVYKLTDILAQNEMPTFKNFDKKIFWFFFISPEPIKEIYAFIKVVQLNPKRVELAIALRGMFKMLIDKIIFYPIRGCVIFPEHPIKQKNSRELNCKIRIIEAKHSKTK